jgi:imidazolonepropionase-like amidohydrolase
MTPTLMRSQAPAVYAIRDARIVTVSGATISKGTVVFRNGLITAVGENTPIPADARVINGSGLTVYPGLIDAHTDLALAGGGQPAQGGQQRPGGGPPAQQQAAAQQQQQPSRTQPEFVAARRLETGGTRIDGARSAGVTTALVIPRTGIFIGQSALVNLGGESAQKLVVKSPVALHIAFAGGGGFGGGFPGSLMGIIAHIRQTFLDAQNYGARWEQYRRNPRGLERPELDESLEALQPVLKGDIPVVFSVNTELEIQRAIKLAEEFKLKYMLSGVQEGYKCAALLGQKKIPVLINLNFPQRARDGDPEADEPLNVLKFRAEAPGTAAKLSQAGVTFAFHSGNAQNARDYVRNAAKAVAAGLSKDAALRALTLNAAQLFGVGQQLGSIETGKIANLVVADGDLFEERTRIKHLFIDGREIELRAEPERPAGPGGQGQAPPQGRPAAPTPAPSVNITGTWNLTVDSPQGEVPVTAELRQNGETITGTLTSPFGQSSVSSGSISNGNVRFTVVVDVQGTQITVVFSGKVEGNRMSGSADVEGQGTFSFSGTKPGA